MVANRRVFFLHIMSVANYTHIVELSGVYFPSSPGLNPPMLTVQIIAAK